MLLIYDLYLVWMSRCAQVKLQAAWRRQPRLARGVTADLAAAAAEHDGFELVLRIGDLQQQQQQQTQEVRQLQLGMMALSSYSAYAACSSSSSSSSSSTSSRRSGSCR